jgi:hypothetical protein
VLSPIQLRLRLCSLLAIAIPTFFAPTSLEAHVFQTNLYPDFELKGDALVLELWVATFLFPPLEQVKFGDGNPRADAGDEDLKKQIETFFAATCPMVFDGVEIAPRLDSLNFEEMEEVSHLGENRDFTMAKLILKYDIGHQPRRFKIRWGLWFPDGEVTVEQPDEGEIVTHDPNVLDILIFGNGEEYPIYITKDEPEATWHAQSREFGDAVLDVEPELIAPKTFTLALAPLLILGALPILLFAAIKIKLPPLALGACVVVCGLGAFAARAAIPIEVAKFWDPGGPPTLDLASAEDQFLRLHRGIYRAFEADSEDAVYNTLAQSVDGAMLDQLYEEVYQSLIMREEGGAISRVSNVEYIDTQVTPEDEGSSFKIACNWRVDGVVRHWGHSHRRSNEYQADYTLAPRGDRWKIASSAVSLQKRVKSPPPAE